MRTTTIWPGPPERRPQGLFASGDQRHVVAAMTTDEAGAIVKLTAFCGVCTTDSAIWTNLATVEARQECLCEQCARAARGEAPSSIPPMLPDHLLKMLRQQAQAEGQSLEGFIEQMLAYRHRQLNMKLAACKRGRRRE